MRHRRTWLLTRWARRQQRQRDAALSAAYEREEQERQAARRRILDVATTVLPTIPPARTTPLLTPGQADRSRRTGR